MCAKKYLKLEKTNDKYLIHVLKKVDDDHNNLLHNEKYIMQCIINNELNNIDYQKWFDLCLQDGKNNELYYEEKSERKQYKINKGCFIVVPRIMLLITMVLITMGVVVPNIQNSLNTVGPGEIIILIIFIPIYLILVYVASSFLSVPIYYLLGLKKTFKYSETYYYNKKINQNLVITQKGVMELQKIYAFESFLKDFSAFASKNVEEIVLWDRYLSYAQVLGLTKKIMKSGYKELIDNASFRIDNIDNITFDNIEIRK